MAGAGKMAMQHLRALQTLGSEIQVVGIADPSSEARTAMLEHVQDAEGAASIRELIVKTQVDVVHVCTPMEYHAEVATEAIENGCHVYIEKPVTPSTSELRPLLELAREKGVKVCAGHQVLFERPYRRLRELLPSLGTPVHIESYFSFRPVRTSSGNQRPLSAAEQLVDVLPHPTYLMLDALEASAPDEDTELRAIEVSPGGTVHALAGRGGLTASLVASLEARPVEHWLRIVGTNGTVHADFVRGSVQELLGPGTSGIDKAFNPLRLSWQLGTRTVGGLGRRILKRGGSYPGLEEIFRAFHEAIREDLPSPTSEEQIRGTVEICDRVRSQLREESHHPSVSASDQVVAPEVLVTGGTGLLGREVVKVLRAGDLGVRVVSRRVPPTSQRVPGVEYVAGDLAKEPSATLFSGIRSVIHCAAETSGGWDEHQRNSIDASVSLLESAGAAGVETFVQVSSVAVLDSSSRGPVTDQAPLHPDPKQLGPYAWGKLESERLVRERASDLGVRVKIVRPVPLVDYSDFSPPGRLGRRLSNLFVAVGRPGNPLVVADTASTARAVVAAALRPSDTEDVMNLVPRVPPSRGDLVSRLRRASPELSVIWLPGILLHPLSWTATLAQKLLRPRRPAVRLASAFKGIAYEPGPAAEWMDGDGPVATRVTEVSHAS